jgi:DNA repair protein RadA/Sms
MQALANVAAMPREAGYGAPLYVSGEETYERVAARGQRIGGAGGVRILAATPYVELGVILDTVDAMRDAGDTPTAIVIDSVQTVASREDGEPDMPLECGGIVAVKRACKRLVSMADSVGAPLFLVGQVRKDGDLGGPKALQHDVDGIFYLGTGADPEDPEELRVLSVLGKNRFGSSGEVGRFMMRETGLVDA